MDQIVGKLKELRPDLRILSSEARVGPGLKFDFYGKDGEGHEVFIEVKRRHCHRVDIGQIVEHASALSKEHPHGKVLLVCTSIDEAVKDTLTKAGIEVLIVPEIAVPATRALGIPRRGLELSPTQQRTYFALLKEEKKVVSTAELASLLDIKLSKAKNLLVALHDQGVLFRVGRGKYAVLPPDVLYERKSFTADPYLVIDALMKGQDYYVSYVSAAHLHGVVTQVPLTALVSTLKQKRPIELEGARIRFVTTSRARFFGSREMDYYGAPVKVSDLEKTIVDCIDRPDLVGGIDEGTRIIAEAVEDFDWDKLADYSNRMSRKALIQRLGFVLERLSRAGYPVPGAILERLDEMSEVRFAHPLDPKGGRKGRLSRRWRVYENADCLRWHHA